MIELNANVPHCRLTLDRGIIQSTVLNTNEMKVRLVPFESFNVLEQVCAEANKVKSEIQGKFRECLSKQNSININKIMYFVGGLSFVSSSFCTMNAINLEWHFN